MPSIQVKGVPSEVHAELRRRASAAGQSLQEYLLERLIAEAATPDLADLLDRAGRRSGGHVTFAQAAEVIRESRDAR